MGKAIVIGAVLVVALLIIAGVWIWTRRHDDGVKGDLGVGAERHMRELVNEAAVIMTNLGPQLGIDDSDFLSYHSKQKIADWMKKFNDSRKEFDRA
jgi:hypothetical protein